MGKVSSEKKYMFKVRNFSGGLNNNAAPNEIADNEFQSCQNIDIELEGAISVRNGCAAFYNQPASTIKGFYTFKKGNTTHLMVVSNGVLRKWSNTSGSFTDLLNATWTTLPIRLYKPGNIQAVENTIASALPPTTTYDYKITAKDAAGATLPSDITSVTRVTTSAAAKQIVITWDKVLAATGYDIYRSTVVAGVPGPFEFVTSVGDVATWTDSGAIAPNPAIVPPTLNTTSFALSSVNDASFVAWNDRLYMTAGNGLICWDGTSDAKIVAPYYPTSAEITISGANSYINATSSLHKCKFIKIFWDRLILCGDITYSQNVYLSDLGLSPSGGEFVYFQDNYAFDLSTDHNEGVSGVSNFRDSLVFFTYKSIHTLFGKQPNASQPEAFTLRVTNNSIGCEAHKSIVTVNNGLMFLSSKGIYSLVSVTASDTSLNVQYLSQKIESSINTLVNSGDSRLVVAVFHKNQYKLAVPGGSMYRYYVDKKAWVYDLYNVDGMYYGFLFFTEWGNYLCSATAVKIVVIGYANTGNLATNDNGNGYTGSITSKVFDLGSTATIKKFRKIFFVGKKPVGSPGSQAQVIAYCGSSSLSFVGNMITLSAEGKLISDSNVLYEFPCKLKGNQIYFQIRTNLAGQTLTFYTLEMQYKIKPV